jgi:hypothetical protein
MFGFLRRWLAPRRREPVVTLDADGVTKTFANGTVESLRFDDLREVHIVTTSGGPWSVDASWLLLGPNGGCVVPCNSEVSKPLLERLQQLPGFDDMIVVVAMGCTDDARFKVWAHPEEE